MRTLFTFQFLLLSLISFGQAGRADNFELTIKFDTTINIDSIDVFFYETNGQSFNSINYRTNKSNNTLTIFGNNEYIIGTKFPTLVFSYRTFESKEYLRADSLNKNNRFPCEETIENTQLFYLITGHHIGSYPETLPTEIEFTLEKNNILITKEWVPDAAIAGGVYPMYTITNGSSDALYKEMFAQNLSISNTLTKINKR